MCVSLLLVFSLFRSPFRRLCRLSLSLLLVQCKFQISGNAWVEIKLLLIIFRSCCHFRRFPFASRFSFLPSKSWSSLQRFAFQLLFLVPVSVFHVCNKLAVGEMSFRLVAAAAAARAAAAVFIVSGVRCLIVMRFPWIIRHVMRQTSPRTFSISSVSVRIFFCHYKFSAGSHTATVIKIICNALFNNKNHCN